MRVLVCGLNYSPEPTGIAPYTAGFARGLRARGDDVSVLTAMPHYPEWRIRAGYEGWRQHEVVDGIALRRLRHYIPSRPSGIRRLLSEVSFGARLVLERWGSPDVVVLVSPALFSSALAALRAKVQGTPYVLWVQDIYTSGIVETAGGRAGGIVPRIIRRVESAVLRSAVGVVVIHGRFADVVESLGASRDRISVVRNWSHIEGGAAGDRAAHRLALGWNDDERIALHTGAMGQKQDLSNVVAAARLARDRGEHVRFVLTGDGGERAELERVAKGLATIEFLDPLPGDRYRQALGAADVLVVNEHAGLRDMAVPSKLTSYFSSGRPVVAATDSTSVTASEIEQSGAGVRVDPGAPEALLDAVLDLGRDTVRAEALGRNGQRFRQRVLSEDGALDGYAEWLRSLLGSGQRRGTQAASAAYARSSASSD